MTIPGGTTIKCDCDKKITLGYTKQKYYFNYFKLLDHLDPEIQKYIIILALKIKFQNNFQLNTNNHNKYIICRYRSKINVVTGGLITAVKVLTKPLQKCDKDKTDIVIDFVKSICGKKTYNNFNNIYST